MAIIKIKYLGKILGLMLLFAVSASTLSLGQTTKIRGRITDSVTGEPLPYVNISIKGTSSGTITDFNGDYYMETRAKGDTLAVSFLGYLPMNKPVKQNIFQTIDFKLVSNNIMLEGVVVTPGENPAHPLIRKIIANKSKNNPERLNNYHYESYNKVEIDLNNVDDEMKNKKIFKQFQFIFNYVDTSAVTGKTFLPIFITETLSDYYFSRNPRVEKEVIKATKISGVDNESVAQFTGKMYQNMNIYDNYINIFDQGFVSPIADLSLWYYKVYLVDSSFIGNRWCYQISFKPRRSQEPTFTGDIWVHDTTFAIVKSNLRMEKTANVNFVKDLVSTSEYTMLGDTLWFLKSTNLFVDFNITERRTTGFFGRKTTTFSNVRFTEEIPAMITKLEEKVLVKEGALKQDEQFWQQSRPFELTKKEAAIYQMVDSVQKVPIYKTFVDIINMVVNYYYVVGYFEIGPYFKTYSFNEIEGNRFRISGRTSNKFSTKVMISGFAAYGDRDNRLKFGSDVLWMIGKNPRVTATIGYKEDIEQLGQSQYALTEDNIVTSFLRRNPNYKLSLVKEFSVGFQKEWFHGFSNGITLSQRRLYPTPFIPFEYSDGSGSLSELSTTTLSLNTRWYKGERFVMGQFDRVSMGSDKPIVNLDLTAGLKDVFGSKYEYYKAHLNLYYKANINPFGYTRIILDGGKVFGKVPYPLLHLHEGNETYAFDRYAFNMMNYYEFASDQYVSLFLEHHFQGFFLNRLPLFKKLKWREVISGKGLIGSLDKKNLDVMKFPLGLTDVSKPYVELSAGVENILKIIRVDAMWRLSYLDNPNIEKFGVRVGLQIIF